MELRTFLTRRRTFQITIVLFISTVLLDLLILLTFLTRPYLIPDVLYRLSAKVFTSYEIHQLKYPGSYLVEEVPTANAWFTIETQYTFHTQDEVEKVLMYMEEQLPDSVHFQGPKVGIEPAYRYEIRSSETGFKNIFRVLDRGAPYIEVYIYPSATSGTLIRISEYRYKISFPSWLRILPIFEE